MKTTAEQLLKVQVCTIEGNHLYVEIVNNSGSIIKVELSQLVS